MMTKTVTSILPISRETDAGEIALAAYESLIDLLVELDPSDWERATECPGWTVADMVGHIIGAAKACAAKRELIRQVVWGSRHRKEYDGSQLDAFNALQVHEHHDLTPQQRIATLRELAPQAVSGRMRTSTLLRRVLMPIDQTGSTAGNQTSISIAKMVDVVYTRDTWMHRVDIASACDRALVLDENDRRIIEDVVADWVDRHKEPVDLTLTGPIGSRFIHGDDGPTITMDAVEFCRVLSGRESSDGLMAWKVLF